MHNKAAEPIHTALKRISSPKFEMLKKNSQQEVCEGYENDGNNYGSEIWPPAMKKVHNVSNTGSVRLVARA